MLQESAQNTSLELVLPHGHGDLQSSAGSPLRRPLLRIRVRCVHAPAAAALRGAGTVRARLGGPLQAEVTLKSSRHGLKERTGRSRVVSVLRSIALPAEKTAVPKTVQSLHLCRVHTLCCTTCPHHLASHLSSCCKISSCQNMSGHAMHHCVVSTCVTQHASSME